MFSFLILGPLCLVPFSLSKIPILFTMSQGKSSPTELVKKFNNWVENNLDWIFIGGGN